jgi:hypothetical protein
VAQKLRCFRQTPLVGKQFVRGVRLSRAFQISNPVADFLHELGVSKDFDGLGQAFVFACADDHRLVAPIAAIHDFAQFCLCLGKS